MNIISKSFMSSMSGSTFGGLLISTVIGTLTWEHIGRKRDIRYRPSVGLDFVSVKSRKLFRALGTKCAWLSSYLTQIDLKEIGVTINDVMKPTWDLVTSPFCAISGYVRTAAGYGRKQWMIYAGSALSIILLSYGLYRYNEYIPFTYLTQAQKFLRLTN